MVNKVKILFIAPIPPPINGQSIAAELLLENVQKIAKVYVVNMAKSSHKDGLTSFSRILEVFSFFNQISRAVRNSDIIYLHISESFFGNLKDLVIYILCRKKINNLFIHLHGGSFGKEVLERNFFLKKINSYFLKKVKGVIILGESHIHIFDPYININKIHIVPNFFLPEFLIPKENIIKKFESFGIIKLLFLSNMISKKGYLKLLEAYVQLDRSIQERIQIDFAGRFNTVKEKKSFEEKIASYKNLFYHGIVSGDKKKKLLAEANVFVLPTSYYEGQPISILEAYASGCAVMVTTLGGIPDIFKDGINGISLPDDNPLLIADSIKYCIENFEQLEIFAKYNQCLAFESYSSQVHVTRLINVLLKEYI